MGVLGLMATSCEDSLEPAIPQSNPQGPVLNVEDVVSEKAGVLASDAVITLENYKSDGAEIPVMKLVKADSLPSGATVSYKLELSSDENFSRVMTLDAVEGEEAGVYSVSASEWDVAHVKLFGKSPKVKTAYYRVPVFINLDGSDYRLNGVDYYAVTGEVKETCMDQGFVIEDNYYLLGNSTTWSLGDAAEVEKYPFYHNPDVSPYDDPVFTIVFNVTQDVLDANGGGCYWKIAPQSVVGTDKWDSVIGTETDGDESDMGMLVTTNAGSGKITAPGKYEITVNMEEMTYSVRLLASVLYVVGEPNGWGIDNDAVYLTETSQGSNVYSGTVKVNEGKFMFRFYSQLGDWDKGSIGAANEDSNVNISFDEAGVYSGDIFQSGVNCTLGKGNWSDPSWTGGAVEITVDLNTNKIEMKKTSVAVNIYLRGGMNGWGTDPAYQFQLTDKSNVWEIPDVTISSGTDFKIADSDWGAVNLGFGDKNTVIPGEAFSLAAGGDNIKMGADFSGKAILTNNSGSYSLLLQPTE